MKDIFLLVVGIVLLTIQLVNNYSQHERINHLEEKIEYLEWHDKANQQNILYLTNEKLRMEIELDKIGKQP